MADSRWWVRLWAWWLRLPLKHRFELVVAIVTATGLITAAAIAAGGGDGPIETASGTIDEPGPGREIRPRFDAQGTLEAIPENRHVWLALRAGNSVYPAEPEIESRGTEWTGQFSEPAVLPFDDVSLVLLLVDEEHQAMIEDWLTEFDRDQTPAGLGASIGDPLAVVGHLTLTTTTTAADRPTTQPPTTLPPTPPASVELESAVGAGQLKTRSEASNETTLKVINGESVSIPFAVSSPGAYSLFIQYSNDNFGPLDNVTVSVDGAEVTVFQAQDTGDYGDGWNVFVESAAIALPEFGVGTHELTLAVAGRADDDGEGVEFDLARFE